jgi:TonB family protein
MIVIVKFFLGTIEFVLILAVAVSSQTPTTGSVPTDQYTAPIEWKLYKVTAADSAIKFPKFPVRNDEVDLCRETKTSIYNAYADQVVYEFRYYAKANEPIPNSCKPRERFEQKILDARLVELRKSDPASMSETDVEINWRKAKLFRWKYPNLIVMRWVMPDMGNNRWREMEISHRPDKNPDEKMFVTSLVFSSKDGIEIMTGSPSTLGDKGFESKPVPASTPASEQRNPLVLKSKPRPRYTDLARERNITGEAHLRVTFLANGGIGSIEVVNGLPNGLTGEAIWAAKRLVFLPARKNGVPINIVRTIQYGFSLY